MPKVVVSDAVNAEAVELLRKAGFAVVFNDKLKPEELAAEMADADALVVRSKTRVDAKLLAVAKQLKVIGRAGAGVDNIDMPAASQAGVIVMNTPGGNSISAAEHTMAMMLSMARKIPMADASVKSGKWDKSSFMGTELRGKTLGVLGLGKIGKEVARRARSFQMTIVAYDPFVNAQYLKDVEVEMVTVEEALQRSDFLTLHLPATPETEKLINAASLKKMKRGAMIINCARGTLVDEPAVIAALKDGTLAGAAFDVFPDEPNINSELRALPNVVLTPHIAGNTAEAQEQVGFDIARQIVNFLGTGEVVNAVNFPSMAREEYQRVKPFLELGEKLGLLVSRIGGGRFEEVGIRYYGELAGADTKLITSHILVGALKASCPNNLNLINAVSVAKERGIKVNETRSTRERDYTNLISVRLISPERTDWVEGSVLKPARLRIVSLDGIDIEAPLTGRMLMIRNKDTPGVIGQVGTLLGQAGVNIANFALGRGDSGEAIGLVNIDGELTASVLASLRGIPAVTDIRSVVLD